MSLSSFFFDDRDPIAKILTMQHDLKTQEALELMGEERVRLYQQMFDGVESLSPERAKEWLKEMGEYLEASILRKRRREKRIKIGMSLEGRLN